MHWSAKMSCEAGKKNECRVAEVLIQSTKPIGKNIKIDSISHVLQQQQQQQQQQVLRIEEWYRNPTTTTTTATTTTTTTTTTASSTVVTVFHCSSPIVRAFCTLIHRKTSIEAFDIQDPCHNSMAKSLCFPVKELIKGMCQHIKVMSCLGKRSNLCWIMFITPFKLNSSFGLHWQRCNTEMPAHWYFCPNYIWYFTNLDFPDIRGIPFLPRPPFGVKTRSCDVAS